MNNENKMLMERLKIIRGEIYELPRSIAEHGEKPVGGCGGKLIVRVDNLFALSKSRSQRDKVLGN